jgi:hypothetical protein
MGQTVQIMRSTAFTGDVDAVDGGWTLRRREVVEEAAGVCARCGFAGADTAIRGWGAAELVAAHTRCVVGLGPPAAARSYPVAA